MMTENSKVKSRSLDIKAADILRAEILNGSLAPGSRLLEIEISERLKLSRGTIRSALQQLIHEGLVVQYPYRGCMVISLSSQDAWELYTLRSTLEGLAAKLAAEAIAPGKVDILQKALQKLELAVAKKNWQDFAIADFNLHKAIIQFSGHRRLQEQYRIIENQVLLYIAKCNPLHPSLEELLADHQQLVEAICDGNAVLSEQIAKAHHTDGELMVKYLQSWERQTSMLKSK
ncbi:MAG: GntR family transcriptional regulator [Xenococcaceae cyanobacterium MO_188.B29]|nr:GntR family transcriptional regulator [Xenococcaceae cyanobacterium MO_188.B29]